MSNQLIQSQFQCSWDVERFFIWRSYCFQSALAQFSNSRMWLYEKKKQLPIEWIIVHFTSTQQNNNFYSWILLMMVMLIMKVNLMGAKDLLLIARNEFHGVGAIFQANKRRNDCGRTDTLNRWIDHKEVNSILKAVMSCQFSIQQSARGF